MSEALSLKALAANKDDPDVKKTDLFRVNPRRLLLREDWNLRDYKDPDVVDQIEAFADSYENGRYVPPLIVAMVNGQPAVVEGHLRTHGALLSITRGTDVPFVDCVPFRGNDNEQIEVMLRSADGLKLKPLAIADGYLRLHRRNYTNEQIAETMRKTPARVEQLLLLAQADHDVRELVRSGKVAADVAIEALREHKNRAGQYLSEKFVEAQSQGKSKVTRSMTRGLSLPPKVLGSVVSSLEAVVSQVLNDRATSRLMAQYQSMDPGQLKGKRIEVDVAALLELVRAQHAVDELKAKRAADAAAAQEAASQQELISDVDPAPNNKK